MVKTHEQQVPHVRVSVLIRQKSPKIVGIAVKIEGEKEPGRCCLPVFALLISPLFRIVNSLLLCYTSIEPIEHQVSIFTQSRVGGSNRCRTINWQPSLTAV